MFQEGPNQPTFEKHIIDNSQITKKIRRKELKKQTELYSQKVINKITFILFL